MLILRGRWGKLRCTVVCMPYHFVQKTQEARIQGPPYRAVYLEHGFFRDYSVEQKMIYPSIRPGNTKGEPVVLDLRWIQYEPHGEIKSKCAYDVELQSLPRRPRLKKDHTFPQLFAAMRPLTYDQDVDLFYLAETLMPNDCLLYYKALPHEGKSIRAEKKKAKKNGKNRMEQRRRKRKVKRVQVYISNIFKSKLVY